VALDQDRGRMLASLRWRVLDSSTTGGRGCGFPSASGSSAGLVRAYGSFGRNDKVGNAGIPGMCWASIDRPPTEGSSLFHQIVFPRSRKLLGAPDCCHLHEVPDRIGASGICSAWFRGPSAAQAHM
jgi:hypothetical protein